MKSERTYLCIDLKTFYASVECADRGLDPFTTNLVVADESRDEPRSASLSRPPSKARRAQPLPPLRNPRRHSLHGRRAPHETLYGSVVRYLRDLPAVRLARRRPYLLDRRMLHRRHAVSDALSQNGARIRRPAHEHGARTHRHQGDGGHRQQSVPGEGGARCDRETRPRQYRHAR